MPSLPPDSKSPAALLRGHQANPARGEQEQQLARIGRARLSQRMAATPVETGFAFNPALRLASGVAALALIVVSALHLYQPKVAPARNAEATRPALSAPPVTVAATGTASEPVPVTAPVNSQPQPVRLAVSHVVVRPGPRAPGPGLSAQSSVAESPLEPVALPATETDPALRLAKVADGVRISWDGQHPSDHQYELTKTCVDLRQPGAATVSARVRLNTSEWVDDSKTGACAPGEAARYEVAELGRV